MRSSSLILLGLLTTACVRPVPETAPPPRLALVDHVVDAAPPSIVEASSTDTVESDEDGDGFAADAIRPCAEGSVEQTAARSALNTLGGRVTVLRDDESPTAVIDELAALLKTPCFELAERDLPSDAKIDDSTTFDSALALKTWWSQGSGAQFLYSYVGGGGSRWLTMPESPRHSFLLSAKNAKTKRSTTTKIATGVISSSHPLAGLVCDSDASSSSTTSKCGAETVGWLRRADASLERRARANSSYEGRSTESECETRVQKAPRAERYATLRECKSEVAVLREVLPLGTFRSPSDGWFVVETKRSGHHQCDELRAYDLATGGVVIASDCNSNGNSGSASTITTQFGHVPVAALREAAFMLMLSGASQSSFHPSDSFNVPETVPIGRKRDDGGIGMIGLGSISCGSRTLHQWSWMRYDTTRAVYTGRISGIYESPTHGSQAADHAVELMTIAQDGFVDTCIPHAMSLPQLQHVAFGSPGVSLDTNVHVDLATPDNEPARRAMSSLSSSKPKRCAAQ